MRTVGFLGLAAILACGGSTTTREPGDASNEGSSSSGSSSGASSSSSGGGTTCQDLENQITQLRPAAQACCPTCNHAPCAFLVDDVCCPVTVDSQTSSAVTSFEQAVHQFKTLKCAIACPGIACRTMPSGNCNQSSSMCQ